MRCLFNVLKWMHSQQFIHNDIRWQNIVYDAVKQQYLLIDFENVRKVCEENCIKHVINNCPRPKIDLLMINFLIDKRMMKIDPNFIQVFKNTLINQNEITLALLNLVEEN